MAITTAALLTTVILFEMQISEHREEAIENKCAQYNPTTSEFEWLKK